MQRLVKIPWKLLRLIGRMLYKIYYFFSDSSRAKQAEAKEDIDNAKTCEDLLEAAKVNRKNVI